MRLSRVTISTALWLLCAWSVGNAQPPSPYHKHLDRIRTLSGNQDATAQFELGYHHWSMGRVYESMAASLAEAMIVVGDCYGDSIRYGEGAEFFGALGAFEAREFQTAIDFCRRASRAPDTPEILRKLTRVVEQCARARIDGGITAVQIPSDQSWVTSMYLTLLSGYDACPTGPTPPAETIVNGVDIAPLESCHQLLKYLCDEDLATLDDKLQRLDSSRGQFWIVEFADGRRIEYADPALIRVMARAHFVLAAHAFSAASTERDAARESDLLSWWGDTGVRLRSERQVQAALDAVSAKPPLRDVYEGWLSYTHGTSVTEIESWTSVAESDYRTQVELLSVLSKVLQSQALGERLTAVRLTETMTKEKEQEKRTSEEGRLELHLSTASAAAWYLAESRREVDSDRKHQLADSALICARRAAYQGEISVARYSPAFCAAYMDALAHLGRIDLTVQALNYWTEMSEFFPMSVAIEHALRTVAICAHEY